ncbi:MAG: hypothetical protein U5K70_04335 [Halodesulfurarchaeum sp.]|nr:hypothetical protein [Halodesulfurarchaeum sp.]
MKIFETGFPDEDVEDHLIAITDVEDDFLSLEALTPAEKMRLQFLKMEAEKEIHRAKGHRMNLRREHRNKMANAFADLVKSIGDLIPW